MKAPATFLAKYPLQPPAALDAETTRLLSICSGRSFNGIALFKDIQANPALFPDPSAASFVEWVQNVYGDFGLADPPAWNPEQLEYSIRDPGNFSEWPERRLFRHTRAGRRVRLAYLRLASQCWKPRKCPGGAGGGIFTQRAPGARSFPRNAQRTLVGLRKQRHRLRRHPTWQARFCEACGDGFPVAAR